MPRHDETELAEALRLSGQEGAALELAEDDEGNGYLPEPPPYALGVDDEDPDIADLNSPDVDTFGEPPLLGARTPATEMFGDRAETVGRATSPKLYAQAAQFPSAVQYRVWRWENGIPVAIGAIDAEALEDDFVRKFYNAMPKEGDGKYQFRFRPVDIRGRELGKEFTINISEHHSELLRLRRQKDREREERGVQDPILINQGSDGAYAEEMGRMFEQAVETAERRTELLQATLEEERDRLRNEEQSRYKERIAVADRSAEVVQKMTERLMETDKSRSKEQLEAQKGQSDMLIQTLTTVFSQQQAAATTQAERLRVSDEARMQQDRAYFDRQRQDNEEKRRSEAQEWERKRVQEREEADRRAARDGAEADRRLQAEKERLELERTRIEEQRKFELEQLRLEAEKRDKRSGDERDRWRVDLEEKRRSEREDWDRKMLQQREDAERRERADRERVERERQDFQLRMERERQEREDAATRRAEQARRDEERRKDEARLTDDRRRQEMELKVKQMDVEAQRAREHQEKMAEQGRLDREARQEAQTRRDALERDARESQDRDRQRQHEFLLRQMELERENAREHQERMMAAQGGGESPSLFGTIGDQLGLEPTELLTKLFGKEDDEGGWADAIPKVLGSIAELGKAAITAKAEQQQVKGRRKIPGKQQGQIVQTPQGPMMVLPRSAQGIPTGPSLRQGPPPLPQGVEMELPDKPFLPPEFTAEEYEGEVGGTVREEATSLPTRPVNTLARAQEAGLPLLDQKKARQAMRSLGAKLADSEEDDWLGLVTQAITDEVGIYYYMRAVSVDAALREASSDEELRGRVVRAMKESGLIPEDVPYTEEDYQRLNQAQDPPPKAPTSDQTELYNQRYAETPNA